MSSLQSQLSNLPEKPGVYLFKNVDDQILYIGKANNLRHRVRSYFQNSPDDRPKLANLIPQIDHLGTIQVTSEFEALILEASLIKQHQPKYNTIAKDDKHPLYIIITKEPFPKISTLRKNQLNPQKHHIYGPFPSSRIIRQVLKTLRRIIPYCTAKHNKGRPCFYSNIGLCNPCPRYILTQDPSAQQTLTRRYQNNIRLLRRLLSVESNYVLTQLHTQMEISAQLQDFELAAQYRDAIQNLKKLLQPLTPSEMFVNNPNLAHEIRQSNLINLIKLLNQTGIIPQIRQLDRIEGYDMSTFQGKQTVGSMVVFYQGEPSTSEYRRFKISSDNQHSDTTAMEEVLTRRFHPKHADKWPHPDLIMVDGGLPQITSAQKALSTYNLNIPLIGLAKREEIIYVPLVPSSQSPELTKQLSSTKPIKALRLTRRSPSLQIIQHLRDEAHRFAGNYHRLLRSKAMLK